MSSMTILNIHFAELFVFNILVFIILYLYQLKFSIELPKKFSEANHYSQVKFSQKGLSLVLGELHVIHVLQSRAPHLAL